MLKAKRGQSSNPLSFELSSSIVSPPHTFQSFTISAALLYRMDPHLLSSLSHNLRIIIRRRRCVMCTHQICNSKSIIQKDLNKFSLSLSHDFKLPNSKPGCSTFFHRKFGTNDFCLGLIMFHSKAAILLFTTHSLQTSWCLRAELLAVDDGNPTLEKAKIQTIECKQENYIGRVHKVRQALCFGVSRFSERERFCV
jgi:hypothetical protein